MAPMRVGYFGPEGTFTQEALIDATAGRRLDLVPLPTIYDTVMAVHSGEVERALVPIENSLEGSVNATLDALAMETEDVAIVGEVVHPIRHCLISKRQLELSEIEVVVSHPQASAHGGPWAALGNRIAAERYGCQVLRDGVEDVPDNETRFVWLSRAGASVGAPGDEEPPIGPWKTAIVFWGLGADAPGWLVSCLSELATREVNLTRIESRPRKQGLGRYMFFADIEGRDTDAHVAEALEGLRARVEVLRVLGSFPAAAG